MRNLPTTTRYLLIANFIIFFLSNILERNFGIDVNAIGGLHYYSAHSFHWWQPFTYMFLHANISHILFNMLALWMFGATLENAWGSRRYLIYYLVCGVGAAIIQECVWSLMPFHPLQLEILNTIGASGAVFGVLFAFGWLFPNTPMFILFIPIPIRARTIVIIYAIVELFAGMGNMMGTHIDNVAHFAHLGGMLFGWLLLLYWRHNNWREPFTGDFWWKIKQKCRKLFNRHQRLDSTKEKDYDNYHYHKRL
jgi:membrane associated rhomboid family serine protease